MAEEVKNTQQAEENRETNPSTQAAEKQDVPYGRFQEKNTQWNERGKIIEQKDGHIAKLEAEKEETRQEALRKAGDIETLLKESQSKNVTDAETIKKQGEELGAFRTGLVDQVPEERRYITDGMSIANLQKFVSDEQTSANAGKTDSSRAGTTAKGDFNGYSSFSEWATKDPKSYEEVNGIVGNQGNQFNVGG